MSRVAFHATRGESIVIRITGNGYKALEAVALCVEKRFIFDATLDGFDTLVGEFVPITQTKATGR